MKIKDDVSSVVAFYLKYASTIQKIFIISAIISFIAGLAMIEDSDGFSIIIGAVTGLCLIGTGIMLKNNFKWKAYMLHFSYEINNK